MDNSLLQMLGNALMVIVVAGAIFALFRQIVPMKLTLSADDKLEPALDHLKQATETLDTLRQSVAEPVAQGVQQLASGGQTLLQGAGEMLQGGGRLLDSVAELIRARPHKVARLQHELMRLQQEAERLRLRHIDVQAVSQQLKIALLELSEHYDSIRRETLEVSPGKLFSRERELEYLGIKTATYKVHVGIDLQALRFSWATQQSVILVHGLHQLEIIGLKDIEITTRLGEIRQMTHAGRLRGAEAVILDDAAQLHACETAHHEHILREIQSPQALGPFVRINARMALVFLQTVLTPKGFQVEESPLPAVHTALSFEQLCQQINQQTDLSLCNALLQMEQVQQAVRAVDEEIERTLLTGTQ